MGDHGHELLFGVVLTPRSERLTEVLELADVADRVGLDLVSVPDHPYQPALLEAWTLLSVIAARTARVSVLPNVANVPLRPPAMLARAAASLDRLSGGRVALGLGAGAYWDAIAGHGGPRLTPGQSVTALEEAIILIRALRAPGGPVHLNSEHYRLEGALPDPFPEREIPVWLGALKPRMLWLTGRIGDGWLPSSPRVPPERLAASNLIIDQAAEDAGRHPSAIRRLYNLSGALGLGGSRRRTSRAWAEQLAELTLEHGISAYLLATDSGDAIREFAAEVAPAARQLISAARAGGARDAARDPNDFSMVRARADQPPTDAAKEGDCS